MQPIIHSLILHRFRSFTAEQIDFANPTFLVGPNGSGKSNLVDALAFLAEAMTGQQIRDVFTRRGGISVVRNKTPGIRSPRNLGIGVVFGALDENSKSGRYAFEIRALRGSNFEVVREQCKVVRTDGTQAWFDRRGTRLQSNTPGLKPALKEDSLGLPLIGGDEHFAPLFQILRDICTYAIEPGRLREAKLANGGFHLSPSGSNAASVLQEITQDRPEVIRRLNKFLEVMVPYTKKVQTIKQGNELALEFTQEWGGDKPLTLTGRSMSDGTLRALGLLLAVYQHPAPSVLVLEEPDEMMHPGALGVILDLLRIASKHMQVIVTTHSPELLDDKQITADQLRIVSWRAGASNVEPVNAASRSILQKRLVGAGELMRSNALDPLEDQKPEPKLFLDLK